MKFVKCPDCGASLDFGEKCDCRKEKSRTGGTRYGKDCVNTKTVIISLHNNGGFVKKGN